LLSLCSSDSVFSPCADDDKVTHLSPPLSGYEFLFSDYSQSGNSDNGSDSDGSYLASLMQHHKEAF
jgi:hypothetical protein